jgi:hypothetical protein
LPLQLTSGTQSQRYALVLQLRQRFTPAGAADATVTNLPTGLTSVVDTAETVTSGTPTASGTYTITTSGHTAPCTAATISGTVTRNLASTIVLGSSQYGTAITTVYTFGGSG